MHTFSSFPDCKLIKDYIQGDENSLEVLIHRHKSKIYNFKSVIEYLQSKINRLDLKINNLDSKAKCRNSEP